VSAKRAALIVASETYEDPQFRQLRAPVRDAESLGRVLQDPAIGGFQVHPLVNGPWHVVREEIEGFFADSRREDLLLLYFSCHGVKDPSGQLYFTTSNTKFRRLAATGISSSFVNEQMNRSRSRRIILLLDCCYSGAFTRGFVPRGGDEVGVTERFEGGGRAVITASSAMEYAFEGDELSNLGDSRPSVFTSALVSGLETGAADRDGDGRVSVDELYDYVYEEVRKATPSQNPSMSVNVQGVLYLARNPRGPGSGLTALPSELRRAVESEFAWQREGAVAGLVSMLDHESTALAQAARVALERLREDDSRRVNEAASSALAARPQGMVAPERPAVETAAPGSREPGRSAASTATAGLNKRTDDSLQGFPLTVTHGGPPLRGLAFSPDGSRLATASDDATARVWDLATGREVMKVRHPTGVSDVAVSPDGRLLATAGADARVWSVEALERAWKEHPSHRA
jgi:Caspase domain/WD domain, G-beta repeat